MFSLDRIIEQDKRLIKSIENSGVVEEVRKVPAHERLSAFFFRKNKYWLIISAHCLYSLLL